MFFVPVNAGLVMGVKFVAARDCAGGAAAFPARKVNGDLIGHVFD
jgi:hypothetical protein